MQSPKFVTTMIMGIGKFYSDGRWAVALRNLIHNRGRKTLQNLLKIYLCIHQHMEENTPRNMCLGNKDTRLNTHPSRI